MKRSEPSFQFSVQLRWLTVDCTLAYKLITSWLSTSQNADVFLGDIFSSLLPSLLVSVLEFMRTNTGNGVCIRNRTKIPVQLMQLINEFSEQHNKIARHYISHANRFSWQIFISCFLDESYVIKFVSPRMKITRQNRT